MFDDDASSPVALLAAMRAGQRGERVATARRLMATGRFCQMRLAQLGDEHGNWCVDDWEAIAAEVGAELGISRGRASSQMHYGVTLLERLPKLAEVFVAGDVEFRTIAVSVYRTALIVDRAALARVDEMLALRASTWNKLSQNRIAQLVDWMVVDLDPHAVRVATQRDADRHIHVEPGQYGMADIWGSLRAPDAAALDAKLDELAATVCRDDARTKQQRRADAVLALAEGKSAMACTCGSSSCTAQMADGPTGAVVIHVLADASTVHGNGAKPGYLNGFGAIPPGAVKQLARRATLRPTAPPKDLAPEDRYRPSAALAAFIRCRDLTCRWPGCDRPASACDIDHTVPYPVGPTHPSNLKLLCRTHHLIKTFYAGPGGWTERQRSDGTVVWTSPSGRTYASTPGGSLFFPQLATGTGELVPPSVRFLPSESRGLMMPTRRRSRAQDLAYRIERERAANRARYAADPPPY